MEKSNVNEYMGEVPVFSVIVPIYNNEKYLHKCIDSLLVQTYTNFELLLIDDGSTDSSGKICDGYAEKDVRIKVFHTGNQGVSMARNLGLSVARGKYINFVDSDDWVKPDYLEKYVEARKEYDYDLVYMEMVRVSENGALSINPLKEFSGRSNSHLSEAFVFLLKRHEFGYACNKSFKRKIIISNKVSFHKEFKLYEDAVFTALYCLHINSIKLVSSAVYYYRIMVPNSKKNKLNYEAYHLATRTGCRTLGALAEKHQSDSLDEAVGVFCQQWERAAILYMYLHGENISREERLNYLKEFRYRLFIPRLNVLKAKGVYRLVVVGMNLKNDKFLDVYFTLFGFIYKLKQKMEEIGRMLTLFL